jgi:polygalacturonase
MILGAAQQSPMPIHFFLVCTLFWQVCLFAQQQPSETDPGPEEFTLAGAREYADHMWSTLPERLARIRPPTFPERDFPVRPGAEDARPAIMEAIEQCSEAGGGRVVLTEGNYHSRGPIHLQSNVNLHLEEGARLTFSQDHMDYTPLVKVRWEGTVAYNFSPFIYAIGKENVAITGRGTIDGGAEQWSREWRKRQNPDKDRIRKMGNDGVPDEQRVFGHGFLDQDGDGADDGYGSGRLHYLRPTLVELYDCKNILIEGVTLTGSCFWTTHPVFSTNVTVRGIEVHGGYLNDDGIDPDSCEDVLIEDCYVETEDDAISIKAGRDQDAWGRRPSKNIIIRDNRLASGVNALCVGSEMSGGVHEVFAENCRLLAGKHALNFKSNLDRGGQVSDVFIRNIRADTLDEALFIFRMDYHGYRGGDFPTKFRDFYVQNVEADHIGENAFKLVGVESSPIENVLLDRIRVKSAGWVGKSKHSENILLNKVSVNGRPVTEIENAGEASKQANVNDRGGSYLITDFGAVSGELATEAIQRAIDAATAGGGGEVIVPPGRFITGSITLASNLSLSLRPGARLVGSSSLDDYDEDHPHLIYASGAENVAITGDGTIDGRGEAFFDKGQGTGERSSSRGWKALERPEPWIVFENCRNVNIRDLRFTNSPSHVISLTDCRDVVIDGIDILNDARSPNTDGIDIRDTRNVRISNCRIETGDDAICLKSKRDTVSGVLVTNCYLKSDDAGIKFGTGTAVAIRDCRFSNLIIDGTRYGIALFMLDGGVNEHCSFENITIRNGSRHEAEYPIFIDVDKRQADREVGKQRFLSFRNMDIFTRNQLLIAGQPGDPIEHLSMRDIRVHVEGCRDVRTITRKPKGNKGLKSDPNLADYAGENATVVLGHLSELVMDEIFIYGDCSGSREDYFRHDVTESVNGTKK